MALTSQRFCLRWNNHQSNLLSVFDQLLHDEAFVDVTLAVEGQFLRAHKMILSACSPYFQALFVGHPDKHPIVILKDVPYADMRSLLDFMYRGEVSVDQDRLTAFLKVAESLRIKGLTEVNEERCDLPSIASSLLSSAPPPPPPPPHLHRIHLTQPKRPLPPMAANPLLGSALTAPKRKRGRPRKLSGSSGGTPGTPGASPEEETGDTDMKLHHPNRTDSPGDLYYLRYQQPVEGHMLFPPPYAHIFPSSPMGPPDLLEVNMGEQDMEPTVKEGDSPRSSSGTPALPEDRVVDGRSDQVKKESNQEPTPGTSQDGQGFKSSNMQQSSEGDPRFATVGGIKVELHQSYGDRDEEGYHHYSDMEECYDDMIVCSPGSSDAEHEINANKKQSVNSKGKLSVCGSKKELTIETEEMIDEDISQYELDSFKSMMMSSRSDSGGPVSPNLTSFDPTKPIDKASVRRYCTHEAENVYRCNVCGKTYTHISNFCRHFLSTHHGVKQEIPCPVCFKLFTRKDNMMTHTKQVHRLTLLRGSYQTNSGESLDHSATSASEHFTSSYNETC